MSVTLQCKSYSSRFLAEAKLLKTFQKKCARRNKQKAASLGAHISASAKIVLQSCEYWEGFTYLVTELLKPGGEPGQLQACRSWLGVFGLSSELRFCGAVISPVRGLLMSEQGDPLCFYTVLCPCAALC